MAKVIENNVDLYHRLSNIELKIMKAEQRLKKVEFIIEHLLAVDEDIIDKVNDEGKNDYK